MATGSAALFLFNTDKISTFLGSPPHHWKQSEIQQIKQIHRCYKNAYAQMNELSDNVRVVDNNKKSNKIDLGDGIELQVKNDRRERKPKEGNSGGNKGGDNGEDENNEGGKDEEPYLPRNSPLRSKNGDKRAPSNATFKDYATFVNSTQFDYWVEKFNSQAPDQFLADTARALVANICHAQSRNQMRIHNGHVPLRKKREHITPLGLCLHEIKQWCADYLRTYDPHQEDTYQQLDCRVKYLQNLAEKEVWGNAAMAFSQGMRQVAQHSVSKIFFASAEGLMRAKDYAYRSFNRRCSREKLHRTKNLLRNLLLNEMRMLSARMTIEKKLADPKTSRLQPTDMLNSIENQSFIDYKNFANVMLFKVVQNPLMKASLTGDFDKNDVKAIIEDISSWGDQNMFCKPSSEGPVFLMDKRREVSSMPAIYGPAASELKKLIRAVDPKAPVPDSPKRVYKRLCTAYEGNENADKVIQKIMKNSAALQSLIPSIYAIYKLWSLAGEGGDFTIYDTMREHVVRVMKDTIKKVTLMRDTQRKLMKTVNKMALEKEKVLKANAIKYKKMTYKPAWVLNHKFIRNEFQKHVDKTFDTALRQLFEIAKDAADYELTTDQLNDKVNEAKRMIDALTGSAEEANENPFEKLPEADKRKNDDDQKTRVEKGSEWMQDNPDFDDEFGKNDPYADQYSADIDDGDAFNNYGGGEDYQSDDSDEY